MLALMEYDGRAYLRLTRDPTRVITPPHRPCSIGRAYRLREGTDVTLISTGGQTIRTHEAADLLANEGIRADALHGPTIKPLDVEAIVASARRTWHVVTAEDYSIIGGSAVQWLRPFQRSTLSRFGGWDCAMYSVKVAQMGPFWRSMD